MTIAEIRRSILEEPAGKKRDALKAWFSGPEGPQALFAGRIPSFDDRAGLIWARLMADGKTAEDQKQRPGQSGHIEIRCWRLLGHDRTVLFAGPRRADFS